MLYPKSTSFQSVIALSLHKYFLTVLGLMFFSFSMSWGQEEVEFKQYTVEDGLTSNEVSHIIQDQRGWLWIATANGLNRFDGRVFKTYRHDPSNPNSLINDFVISIYEDRSGMIWIGTIAGLDRYDPVSDQFFHYLHQSGQFQSLSSNVINCILEDQLGNIWIGTDRGLNRFVHTTGKFEVFQSRPNGNGNSGDDYIYKMIEDQQGFIWSATSNGLYRFDHSTKKLIQFGFNSNDQESLNVGKVWSFHEDREGGIWVGTEAGGLFLFDPATQTFDHFQPDSNTKWNNDFYSIYEGEEGKLWLGAKGKLFGFETKTRKFNTHLPKLKTPSNSEQKIISIFQDREGSIWIGTNDEGIYSFRWKETNSQLNQHDPNNPFSLSNNVIQSIYKDRSGDYWLGTQRGLNLLNPITQQCIIYLPNSNDQHEPFNSENSITAILEDRNQNLWIGTQNGLKRFDRKNKQFFHYWHDPGDSTTIGGNRIRSLFEDQGGRLWIVVYDGGLNLYDPGSDSFTQYLTSFKPVFDVCGDYDGHLWVGTFDGLIQFDPAKKVALSFRHDPNDIHSISSNVILDIYEDSHNRLWIGTNAGLNLLHRESKHTFEHFLQKDGLAHPMVLEIKEDNQNNLWLSDGNGISVFQPDNRMFNNYSIIDNFELTFGTHIYPNPETQKMWLGTENGLIIIHPDSLPYNDYKPPVYISSLSTYQSKRKESGFQEINAPWAKTAITLPFGQNTFTAEFAILSYKNPAENEAAYKLEGVSDEWIPLGSKREATFSNLRPGNYTLRVKGSNNDGVWNEKGASLEITILPPWWLTFWAKLAYVLLAVGTLYNLYRFQLRRKLALAETKRLQELDAVKTKLFTNITHEFRTPLTVIQGMADHTIDQEGNLVPEKHLENAQLIKRNSAQLLTLVNQMLDLRKLESGALPLRMQQGDVIQYLRYLTESFHSHARNKEVGLHFLTEQKELMMDYDPEKLLYIVSNLLSNAIKFTPRDGNVYMSVNSRQSTVGSQDAGGEILELKVKDSGIGIEAEKLPHIFDRFYQADDSVTRQGEGSGIGLALCRELVKLLGGEIKVSSELGQGSVFTVTLPITKEAVVKEVETAGMEEKVLGFAAPAALAIQTIPTKNGEDDLPLALIIEDNPDVTRYLNTCLEQDYKILTSMDGQTGIETAIDVIPDIIISDVMMPKKDGYEVCDILKNDERTSHIPIILLTAKADLDSRIKGLAGGADAYLAKPFHREELQVRLEQLIELRKKLQETYSGLEPSETSLGNTSIENEFLRKVRQIVEEQMEDSEFGIVQLCRAIGLSRSQLFRKLKALTGKSASLVIRSIRLQRARKLLQTTDLNVSEVAYEVGFKDLAYFSKCFLEEYGETPSSVKAGYS